MIASGFLLGGSLALVNFNITITSNTSDYNVKNAITALGWNKVTPANVTITVNSGVYLGGYYSYGFYTDALPSGSKITLINNGYIAGRAGGFFGVPSGGSAMGVVVPLTLTNNGTIAGAGNQGADGGNGEAEVYDSASDNYQGQAPGYGGAGGYGAGWASNLFWSTGQGGSPPTYDTSAYGSNIYLRWTGSTPAGAGSAGNNLGDGASIEGNANVTYAKVGTLIGPRV
jgi:hypothetical protein